MVGVEQWAEIRRLYFVKRLSIKEIVRRTATAATRSDVRCALLRRRAYRRPPRSSKLDPFRDEVHRLLRSDPRLPGKRLRELLEEQGYVGAKTILDDYLREVRPLFLPRPRTFQRTSYRPGALCQFDLWQPSREIRSVPARRGAATSWLAACRTRARVPARSVLEVGARPAVRDRRVPAQAGRSAGDARLGPRGCAACGRRPPTPPRARNRIGNHSRRSLVARQNGSQRADPSPRRPTRRRPGRSKPRGAGPTRSLTAGRAPSAAPATGLRTVAAQQRGSDFTRRDGGPSSTGLDRRRDHGLFWRQGHLQLGYPTPPFLGHGERSHWLSRPTRSMARSRCSRRSPSAA